MGSTIGSLFVELRASVDPFISDLKKAQREADATSKGIAPLTKGLKDLGEVATAAGTALTAGVTAPIVALGAVSIRAAADFESAFAGVRKTVDGTEEDFRQLSEGFRDMALQIPATVTELAGIGEAAGQLGIKKENILSFTETMSQLGVTTNLTSQQAATELGKFANIVQMSQGDFDRLGSTIVALGNAGASTESEIAAMSLRLAGAAHQVGMNEAQILSFASALSSVGIEAEAGGSAFSKVFIEMSASVEKGDENLALFAKTAGMSGAEFKRAFKDDAATAVIAFTEGLERTRKSGGSALSVLADLGIEEVRMRDALLRASSAGELFNEQMRIGTQAWKENTALTKEAEERYKTFDSQWQLFKNTLNDVAIELGMSLLPLLKDLLEIAKPIVTGIGEVVSIFSQLPEPVKAVAFGIAAVAAAIGPMLLGFGFVATHVASLIPAFLRVSQMLALSPTSLATVSGLASQAFTAMGGAMGILSGVVIVALVYSIYKLYDAYKSLIAAQGELEVAKANEQSSANRAIKTLRDHGIAIDVAGKSEAERTRLIGEAGKQLKLKLDAEADVKAGIAAHGAALRENSVAVDTHTKLTKEQTKAQKEAAKAAKDWAKDVKDATEDIAKANEKWYFERLKFKAESDKFWENERDQAEDTTKKVALEYVKNQAIITGALAKSKELALDTEKDYRKSLDKQLGYLSDRYVKESNAQVTQLNQLAGAYDDWEKKQEDKRKASFDSIRDSAGHIFDGLLAKGENVFTDLVTGLKGGVLSIGRAIFEDITASFLGPIKAKFDDFVGGVVDGLLSKITGKVSGLIGGLFGGGSGGNVPVGFDDTMKLLGNLGIGGAGAAGGAAAGGGTAAAGGSGGLGSVGALLTNPWTIAIGAGVVGITAWIKSQAHHEANTIVKNIENPFWEAWARILPTDNVSALAALSAGEAEGVGKNLFAMNANYLSLVNEFRKGGSDEELVARKSVANTQPHVTEALAALRMAITSGGGVPSFRVGTPSLPQDGLYLGHQGERIVTAQDNQELVPLLRAILGAIQAGQKIIINGRELMRTVAGDMYYLSREERVLFLGSK